jgi:hypothetical protein
MTACDLGVHVGTLADTVMMPWFLNDKFKVFRLACEQLIDGLQKYLSHLQQQQKRTAAAHAATEPVRSISDSWTMRVIEGNITEATQPSYRVLQSDLEPLDMYEPLFLLDHAPDDRIDRRYWMQNLLLPFP